HGWTIEPQEPSASYIMAARGFIARLATHSLRPVDRVQHRREADGRLEELRTAIGDVIGGVRVLRGRHYERQDRLLPALRVGVEPAVPQAGRVDVTADGLREGA